MTRYAWSRKKEVLELSDFNANRKMRCTADFAHDDPLASWSTKTSCFLHVKNWVEKHICFRGHMGTEKSKGFQHKIFGKLEKKIAIFSHLNLNYYCTLCGKTHIFVQKLIFYKILLFEFWRRKSQILSNVRSSNEWNIWIFMPKI